MKRSCPENYRFNSDKNQKIKEKFVNREVNENQTGFIGECLKKEVFSYGDIINNDEPEDRDKYDRLQKLMKALDVGMEKYLSHSHEGLLLLGKKELIQDQIDNLEIKSKEIFEWYSITEWFAEKLEAQGEAIISYGNFNYWWFAEKLEAQGEAIISYGNFNYWWGRTCSGQAILLDGVISEICWEMGILEGQESEWQV